MVIRELIFLATALKDYLMDVKRKFHLNYQYSLPADMVLQCLNQKQMEKGHHNCLPFLILRNLQQI